MNKKVLWSIIVVLCLIIVLAILFFVQRNKKIAYCTSDIDLKSIVETGDVGRCDCFVDQVKKTQCQESITNASSYVQALQQSDTSSCANIKLPAMKAACLNLVQKKTD